MPALLQALTVEPNELAFGTSGLRGLVTDMTDLECYINAAGFLRFLQDEEQLPAAATVYLAGDLRHSTPRIMQAVAQAIVDGGYKVVNCGFVPTPAVALYALQQHSPCIMVTGSHIPDDRNGIKFYKAGGEVLKADELGIKTAVAAVRDELYAQNAATSAFNAQGMLRTANDLPEVDDAAKNTYIARYTSAFGDAFTGKQVVLYQHSAVGRDILLEILKQLGAEVVPVGRSQKFIPIDTENVTLKDQAYFAQLAREHPKAFAIVSTDGDSDRPFVIDAQGVFHRGDVLGAVVADWLQADFAAFPVSASDAVDAHLTERKVPWEHTKIGSPYVIVAMQLAAAAGKKRVVGWEVNGGFLIGEDLQANGVKLSALPTRDAALPIIVALKAALDAKKTVAQLFAELPQRYTQAGLIDNFPLETSRNIVAHFGVDTDVVRGELAQYFTPEHGFDEPTKINALDGVRVYFASGDIAHIRPSGNAPQLRIYSVANNQARADDIVAMAIAEPQGIFRQMQQELAD